MTKLCSVYCHTSPSGKKYVGISYSPEKRWNNGKGYAKNYRFSRAIEKYGWDSFSHEIIATVPIEDAIAIEKHLIEAWNLTDFSFGYNLRSGGDGPMCSETRALLSKIRKDKHTYRGYKPSAETREKISKSLKSYYSTHKNPMKGRHHSKETIFALASRVVTEETREKMRKHHADVSGSLNPSAKAVRKLSLSGNPLCDY